MKNMKLAYGSLVLLALGSAATGFARGSTPTATPTPTPTPCDPKSKVCVCSVSDGAGGSASMTVPEVPDANGSCEYLNNKSKYPDYKDCSSSCPPDNSEPSGPGKKK